MVEGAAIGIAVWCMLLAFQLLPGKTADTPGVLIFGLAGIALNATPFRAALLAILAIGAVVIVVVSQTDVSNVIASRWIRCDALPDSGVAAVVVLSAAVNPNETMSGEALDHLLTGLELITAGTSPLLVTTTVQRMFPSPTGLVSSETDQSRILALFGARVNWMRIPAGHSTRDEALNAAKLLLPRRITRIAVVASRMHTHRACSAFEAVGFDVTCVPARTRIPTGLSPGSWPQYRLAAFGDWVYEVASTAKYQWHGWLSPRRTAASSRDGATDVGLNVPVAPARHTWCD